jgi:hypothetical protein
MVANSSADPTNDLQMSVSLLFNMAAGFFIFPQNLESFPIKIFLMGQLSIADKLSNRSGLSKFNANTICNQFFFLETFVSHHQESKLFVSLRSDYQFDVLPDSGVVGFYK